MEYKHLKRWKHPQHYFGVVWPGWYVVMFRNRDSDALERANFDATWALLEPMQSDIDLGQCGPDNDGPSIQTIRESHWAVGWVEWIGIHESNTRACEAADKLLAKLEDYPVVDEELWGRYEDEECGETWRNCYSPQERLTYFRNHSFTSEGIVPLLRAIRGGDWGYAASMLHNPSDLI